jgi:phosphatidylglycerophosphate synthase
MARKYDMVTKFGDLYDHFTDVVVGIGLVYVVIMKYFEKINRIDILSLLILGFLMQFHIGCQQKYYTENKKTTDTVIESIDKLSGLCKDNKYMRWTRFFGTGTFLILSILIIYNIHNRNKQFT